MTNSPPRNIIDKNGLNQTLPTPLHSLEYYYFIAFNSVRKPPYFDGEDYSWWSHKIKGHLYSLHPSIWDIVKLGMQIPDNNDEDCNSIEVEQIVHHNSQANTVLLASLCSEGYNRVNGLERAKEFWDTLKIAHEGDKITKITKMKLLEGELKTFAMNKEEGHKRCTTDTNPW
jgi:hypothetical protein